MPIIPVLADRAIRVHPVYITFCGNPKAARLAVAGGCGVTDPSAADSGADVQICCSLSASDATESCNVHSVEYVAT
eukprot:6175751-Pleurochrysis_carterae.AAC.2